jgi:uncharacterized membrane protein YqjE
MKDARKTPDSIDPKKETKPVNIVSIVQMLGSAGEDFLAQASLHRQLVAIEWQQEKVRLTGMLTTFLLGFCCFLCLMIFISAIVILLTWNTEYQVISLMTLGTLYTLGAYLAWKRFMRAANRTEGAFAATRAEIAADLAMIKSKIQ